MEKRDRLLFSPWLTLKAFIKYYLMVENGRSGEPKKSPSPIMCWIYAWQILSHNMSLIYVCPQVWAIIIKEAGEIWPDGGRCDSRMRTVEVPLKWRGDLTFRWAKTVRFVNSSRRAAHTKKVIISLLCNRERGIFNRLNHKKENGSGHGHGFLIHTATRQNSILHQPWLQILNLWPKYYPHEQRLLSKLELRGEFQRQTWHRHDALSAEHARTQWWKFI